MPDYDPKSIPILDDVIEKEITDTTSDKAGVTNNENEVSDTIDTESGQAENNPDLFSEGSIELVTEYSGEAFIIETAEPQTAITDDIIDEEHSDDIEYTLTDYNTDNENNNDSPVIDVPSIKSSQQITAPVSLESMVDDIVKQLMPDLEQHLRYLVQQTLEDKLTDEVVNQLTTKNDSSE